MHLFEDVLMKININMNGGLLLCYSMTWYKRNEGLFEGEFK